MDAAQGHQKATEDLCRMQVEDLVCCAEEEEGCVSAREQALLEAIDRLWDRIGCPELEQAIGPYELEAQSSEELELEPAWSCPFCGEEGGEPVLNTWREYQGVSPHGGMVEFEEQMCTKCSRRRGWNR